MRFANGTDLRDLYRRGSGMTLRRLWVLVRALPSEALLWSQVEAARQKALKPTADHIRERQAHYDRLKNKRQTEGVSG